MIPNDVEELLYSRFGYPNMIIAQVATLSANEPAIRSMGLFDIDAEGRLIFLTNRGSHKWTQLSRHPTISVLLLNLQQDAQIIAKGYAELLSLEYHRDLLEHYWLRTPHGARLTYEHQHPEGKYIPLNTSVARVTAPDNFGMIRVIPTNWEILDIDVNNYPASRRISYEGDNKDWKKNRLNAI